MDSKQLAAVKGFQADLVQRLKESDPEISVRGFHPAYSDKEYHINVHSPLLVEQLGRYGYNLDGQASPEDHIF